MRLDAKKAELIDSVAGKVIQATDKNTTIRAIDLDRLGTQRVYGRNGVQIIAKIGEQLYIIPKAWNTSFARKTAKILPNKQQHPAPQQQPISILWVDCEVWCPVVDEWAGIGS
jgi:hypothetical protein